MSCISRERGALCLVLLGAAAGLAIWNQRAGADWSLTFAAIGLAAAVVAVATPPRLFGQDRAALLAALLIPAYVAWQLIPMPVALLGLLDPARAEIADSLHLIGAAPRWVPVTIAPAGTFGGLCQAAGYALIFLLARTTAARFRDRPWVPAWPLIGAGVLEAALGIAQRAAGEGMATGTYASKDHYAGLLEMTLPLALMYGAALLHAGRRRRGLQAAGAVKACLLAGAAAAMFGAVGLSLSKMGFVSAAGALCVMGAVALAANRRPGRKWLAAAATAALAGMVLLLAPPVEMVLAFGNAAGDATAEGRLPMAMDALRLIAAYPLFGSGFGTYLPALLRYQTFGLSFAIANAHNDYLQLLAELGAAGMLAAAALACLATSRAVRAALHGEEAGQRYLGLACAGSFSAIAIHSLADFNLYVPANAAVLAWIAGMAAALGRPRRPVLPQRSAAAARAAILLLGILTAAHACGRLALHQGLDADPRVERAFCRFGICASGGALNALVRRHGSVAAVPPEELLEFLRRDPAAPSHWQDLGESLERSGRTGAARACFARARLLGPHIPFMQYREALFRFDLQENAAALRLAAESLAGNPALAAAMFTAYDRRGLAVRQVAASGLPPNANVYRAYLEWQMARHRAEDAGAVWDAITARGYADIRLANRYVEFLMAERGAEPAARAWAAYTSTAGGELTYNGDFEAEPTGSRFDWTLEPAPGVSADFDAEAPHAGARSLRLRFDGRENVSRIGVRQSLYLKPGRYRFEAYARAREISTDEGVAFQVIEAGSNRTVLRTPAVLGSSGWQRLGQRFQVTTGGLVEIRLVRTPSLRFDNRIGGTMWVDGVSVKSD